MCLPESFRLKACIASRAVLFIKTARSFLYAVHGIENIHMLKADILVYFVFKASSALQRGKIHIAGGGINKHHHGKIILHGGLAYIEYVNIKPGKLSGHLSNNAYFVFSYNCNDRFHKNVMPCGILSMDIFCGGEN